VPIETPSAGGANRAQKQRQYQKPTVTGFHVPKLRIGDRFTSLSYACGGADLQKEKVIKLVKHKNRPIPQNKPVLLLRLQAPIAAR
jgi:hypothetical protein